MHYCAAPRHRLQDLAPIGSRIELRLQTIDKYGRSVAEIFRNGQSVNLLMVSSGDVYVYRKYLRGFDQAAYGREDSSDPQRIGVCSVSGGIQQPSDWERSRVTLSV